MQNVKTNTLVKVSVEKKSRGFELQLFDSSTVKRVRVEIGISSCGNICAVSLRKMLRD